jgi:hypothetical protein
VSEPLSDHVDETGAPCTRHRPATAAGLLQLAMVGSRAPAFHHDCASKLQGLVMALDELTELTENGDPQLVRAIEAAAEVSRDLNALLTVNRALTKPANKTPIGLRELMKSAAARVGVSLQGSLPELSVSILVPAMTHALALTIDVAAGAGRGRALVVTATPAGREVELAMHASASPPTNASESMAIATFVVARDGGRLWCSSAGDQVLVRLPLA